MGRQTDVNREVLWILCEVVHAGLSSWGTLLEKCFGLGSVRVRWELLEFSDRRM